MSEMSNLKKFALGALWAAIGGTAPAAVMVYDWVQNWRNPVDWSEIAHVGLAGAAFAVLGYWRKHRALLTLPPWMEDAADLKQSAAQTEAKS